MLNRLLRYAPVAADVDPAVGVLDVGCGQLGLGAVFDGARFAGQDVAFAGTVAPAMFAVRTAAWRFPWADGAFDTVLCLDTLERVPPADRAEFVAECARVAARRVLIASTTAAGSDFLAGLYRSAGAEPPGRPGEHALPSAAELKAFCDAVKGFTAGPWAQVNGHLAALTVVGDLNPSFAADFAEHRAQWTGALQGTRFGEGVRGGFELLRDDARPPLVDPGRFDASAAAALECVACGTRLRLETAVGLRCIGCGRIPARDATGTWDLT